jgi:hypothetical protein
VHVRQEFLQKTAQWLFWKLRRNSSGSTSENVGVHETLLCLRPEFETNPRYDERRNPRGMSLLLLKVQRRLNDDYAMRFSSDDVTSPSF